MENFIKKIFKVDAVGLMRHDSRAIKNNSTFRLDVLMLHIKMKRCELTINLNIKIARCLCDDINKSKLTHAHKKNRQAKEKKIIVTV